MKKIVLCFAILVEVGFALGEYETLYKNNDFVGAYTVAGAECVSTSVTRACWFEGKMLYEGKGVRQDIKKAKQIWGGELCHTKDERRHTKSLHFSWYNVL